MEYFVNYYNNDFERIKHDSKIERIMIENNEPLRTKSIATIEQKIL